MKLPKGFKTETVISADYDKFEELVLAEYGTEYSFPGGEESGNDTSHDFEDMKKAPLDDYDTKKLEKFKATGDGSFLARTLMQDLVNNDVLPEGGYIIRVSW